MEREQVILISNGESSPPVPGDDQSTVLPKYASTPESMKLLLENPLHDVLGMFIECDNDDVRFINILQMVLNSRPGLPVYLLDPGGRLESLGLHLADLKKLGVHKVFEDTPTFMEMAKLVDPHLSDFDKESALLVASLNQDVEGSVSDLDNSEFREISARHFLSGSEALFDIYVRLPGGKHVKITQAGQALDGKRISNYLKKGVKHFYLQKEAQKTYLKYCNHLAARIRMSDNFPDTIKTAQSLHAGDQLTNIIDAEILSDEHLMAAAEFVNSVNDLAANIAPKGSAAFTAFLNDADTYTHGVATTMMASIVAKELEFENQTITERIGLAALFHDLGMKLLPENLRGVSDENELSLVEKAQYRTHPELGAKELAEIPYLHESVIQAVAHHHVRKDSLGFPIDVPFANISLMAQIIGVSDEIVHAVEHCKKTGDNFHDYMEQNVLAFFSNHLAKAVRKILFPEFPSNGPVN